ncbi:MAG: NADH-quinone oxidoreductase subunit A [Candidatus Dormibacteria bacterium]
MLSDFLPVGIFLALATVVALLILGISVTLGPRRPLKEKSLAYECGIKPETDARQRLSVRFYLTAMLFIIFDVEAVFFYPWAVLLRQLKVFGLVEMVLFIGILAVALGYVWRKGGLEWD